MQTVGIISGPHKLLRPEALDTLSGADLIIHAGDIGSIEVIDQLRELAPVEAIKGNIDKAPWAAVFPNDTTVNFGGKQIYVLHNLNDLDIDPVAAGFDIVISGHSHAAKINRNQSVLYINPGSAGPRRFKLPITVALLKINACKLDAQIKQIVLD